MCHMSHVTCHVSHVTIFFYTVMKQVVGGSIVNGATPSSLLIILTEGREFFCLIFFSTYGKVKQYFNNIKIMSYLKKGGVRNTKRYYTKAIYR